MQLDGLELTWLGHAAFRFRTADGTVSLVDPWLSGNPACPEAEHEPERVDAIYLTHGHFDHVGDTVALAKRHAPRLFAIHEISVWLEGQGLENVTGLNMGGTVAGPGGVSATFVPAVHSSGISGEAGIVDGGDPGGWVLAFDGGPTIYHAGDTMVFGDMALIGELWQPDIALLPIGGHYTMDPRQAAKAAKLLGVSTVVPMHYGTFPILAGTPEELRDAAGGAFEVVVLTAGEPVT